MSVITECYNKTREWDNREEAMEYFSLAMEECDSGSSEYERYEKVYTKLQLGYYYCSDRND